jgi:uncharacterized protein (DUF2249 family)
MKIERNIPVPPRHGAIVAKLRELKPKDSVLITEDISTPDTVRTTVARLRIEFEGTRSFVTATSEEGIRVWRTA